VATTDSGWDMLWYQIPPMLSRKVVLGSTWQLLGCQLRDVLVEVTFLGLGGEVSDRWQYRNLAGILRLADEAS
jgi:hypothetical protein